MSAYVAFRKVNGDCVRACERSWLRPHTHSIYSTHFPRKLANINCSESRVPDPLPPAPQPPRPLCMYNKLVHAILYVCLLSSWAGEGEDKMNIRRQQASRAVRLYALIIDRVPQRGEKKGKKEKKKGGLTTTSTSQHKY